MEVSRRKKKQPQRESLSVEVYFGWLFGTMTMSMSGQCWAVLGLCWDHVGSFDWLFGFHAGFWGEKTNPNRKACPLRFILGDFVGLCQWPMLGCFGSILSPSWVIWGAERSFQKLLRSFHASIQIAEHMAYGIWHVVLKPPCRLASFRNDILY